MNTKKKLYQPAYIFLFTRNMGIDYYNYYYIGL